MGDQLHSVGTSVSAARTRELVLEALARVFQLPAAEIESTTTFAELGADSVDLLELQVMLLEAVEVELSREDAVGISNVGELVSLVLQRGIAP